MTGKPTVDSTGVRMFMISKSLNKDRRYVR